MPTPGKRPFTYEYPRPALSADAVLATREARPRVLLIKRKHDPFIGRWALPVGFVNEGETIAEACAREVREETGLTVADLEQLYTSGDPGRNPRGWVVTVAFLGRVDAERLKPQAGDDAAEVGWFPLDAPPDMAFDHAMLLARARARLEDRKP